MPIRSLPRLGCNADFNNQLVSQNRKFHQAHILVNINTNYIIIVWLPIGIWGVQTLFYGLRKSRRNAFPRCDIMMSHTSLVHVLQCDAHEFTSLLGSNFSPLTCQCVLWWDTSSTTSLETSLIWKEQLKEKFNISDSHCLSLVFPGEKLHCKAFSTS